MPTSPTPDVLYRELAEHMGETLDMTPSHRFGAAALKRNGRIYAALTAEQRLLLKLPAVRVAELIGAGQGERFHSGGRPMREWVTVGMEHAMHWPALAREAREHVAGTSSPRTNHSVTRKSS